MHLRLPAAALLLACVCFMPGRAAESLMPVDEVRPGMVGVGRTVFGGTTIEEFKVHVVGVLRNMIGPSRSLIVARLEGGPLEKTGVIAGMSGSPVYIDGRLVGAVSYSLGNFSREPIAGITPIAEMIEATAPPATRPASARLALSLPVTPEALSTALRETFAAVRPFASSPADVRVLAGGDAIGAQVGAMLRPIATPVVLGGFSGDAAVLLTDAFGRGGFLPVAGAATASPDADAGDLTLRPGDAVGVGLVTGDLALGATGTVTHIDNGRVYAFGHPFYNLGPTVFPMTKAWVHTLLPSLMSSSKLASMGATIGTVQQDRATAIAGSLGPGPSLLPIRITLETSRGATRTFQYEVVRDQLFTPLLAYVSILNTLQSYEREYGAATFSVKGRALVRKHGEVAFENLFTGDQPSAIAASYVAGPLTFLLRNDVEPVEIDELHLTIASSEEPRTATLQRAWVDAVDVRPGRTVPLRVAMRTYRGEEFTRTVPIEIPANARGSFTIMVADAARLTQWEQREIRQPAQAQGVAQMVRALNRARKNDRLYVRLLTSDAGAVVSGEPLTALPPSVLAVLEADRSGGGITPLRNAVLGEWEIPIDHAVTGVRLLPVSVEGAN